ncbi:MAG: metal ABC transporter permease [Verrucomicrobiia bacterium]
MHDGNGITILCSARYWRLFLMGPVCGLLGIFITLRGMAFFSDAIAHSALTGIALGLFAEQFLQSWFHWHMRFGCKVYFLLGYCLIIA